jgi:hypothetical protein
MGKIDDAVRKEIARFADSWVSIGDPSRDAALIMIAALFVEPDVGAVAAITGCPLEIVNVVADRLRASGLWVDGGTDYSDWSAKKPLGIINFGLDLDVAEGVFTRTAGKENDQYGYKLVEGEF